MTRGLWLKLSADYADDPKVIAAGIEGEVLFIRSLAWCKRHADTGEIPDVVASRLAAGIADVASVTERLVHLGLWLRDGSGYRVAAWENWQVMQDLAKSHGGSLGAHRRWHRSQPDPSCEHCMGNPMGNPLGEAITKPMLETELETELETTYAPEVQRLCELLANLMQENGCKRTNITKAWLRHMDLLLRVDGHDPAEVESVIRWSQADDFWKANILSTSSLRKQYDKLRLRMSSSSSGTNIAEARWHEVAQAIRKRGHQASPATLFTDERTLAAVRAVGWMNLCQANEQSGRRMFIDAYMAR